MAGQFSPRTNIAEHINKKLISIQKIIKTKNILKMKLWQKNYNVDGEIEKFTVGNDFLLDKALVKYDVYGSIAHASMLKKIGILKGGELQKLKKALVEILKLSEGNKFDIKQQDEDCHTAIENYLTKKLGDLGKKIHTARSRNDQVLVDLRLYSKDNLLEAYKALASLVETVFEFAEKNKNVPIPGYTHTRKAMPSSVGLLFGAYAESLIDDFELLKAAYNLNDQNPLGSAAGYGVNLEIDRQFTTNLLGFKKVQNNSAYAQNSRGKIESIIIFALSKIMEDLSKIASDLILFSMDEFGFFSLPDKLTTGSSLMPHKKNPDVLELIRGKASVVQSYLILANNISPKFISGYHRDFQLTKEPLIKSFEIAIASIKILGLTLSELKVNKEKCISSFTNDLFATDQVIELTKKGIPFREAYKEVGANLEKITKINPVENIKSKKHVGATGNLGLDKARSQIQKIKQETEKESKEFYSKISLLAK